MLHYTRKWFLKALPLMTITKCFPLFSCHKHNNYISQLTAITHYKESQNYKESMSGGLAKCLTRVIVSLLPTEWGVRSLHVCKDFVHLISGNQLVIEIEELLKRHLVWIYWITCLKHAHIATTHWSVVNTNIFTTLSSN